jgi:hypothetical protein
MHHICDLGDSALEAEVRRLSRTALEAHTRDELVAHLAELDARRLYARAEYASLFAYCCGALRLPEPEAKALVEAARALRRHAASIVTVC